MPPVSWSTRVQDRWSVALGCAPDERADVVAAMMRAGPSESTGYWLQLALSVGIATMGLVLDSGAVVIAAMLVAPLMGPIVALGMGLAIGSPFLVVRSSVRTLLSAAIAVAAAAAIVRALPFQTMTPEIAARAVPTALDLGTAAFCALAGVYAAMRPSSDVASTAAGTSIGISLVPPLCASGYGLGTMDLEVAGGAALLFLANVVAIIVIGTMAFAAVGFNRVDVAAIERVALEAENGSTWIVRFARRFSRVFSSRHGIGLRIAMPLVLLAVVAAPLVKALDEVTWQIRVRSDVDTLLGGLDVEVLESRVNLDRRSIELAIVFIGTTTDAADLRTRLDERLREVTGAAPRLAVYAVPDASDFAGLQAALRERPVAPIPPPVIVERPPAPEPQEQVDDALSLVTASVERHWPEVALGGVLATRVEQAGEGYRVTVTHHGPALDGAAREVLERALAEELGRAVEVSDAAIPRDSLVPQDDLSAFALELAVWIERSRPIDAIVLCAQVPPPPKPSRRRVPPEDPARARLLALFATHPRSEITEGVAWNVRFSTEPCANGQ